MTICGQSDGSVVKSTSRRPKFNSQHPYVVARNSSSRRSKTLFWPLQVLPARGTQTRMLAHKTKSKQTKAKKPQGKGATREKSGPAPDTQLEMTTGTIPASPQHQSTSGTSNPEFSFNRPRPQDGRKYSSGPSLPLSKSKERTSLQALTDPNTNKNTC